MRIIILMLFALLLTNCTNSSYVKNKKSITSPNDLQKFYNIYCDKNKTTDKVIKMCGSAFSKDLMIAESKSIMSAKIKIADIVNHSLIRNEQITHKENGKGVVVKTYKMTADNQLIEATINGYQIVSKKILKEKNGYRVFCLLSYKLI